CMACRHRDYRTDRMRRRSIRALSCWMSAATDRAACEKHGDGLRAWRNRTFVNSLQSTVQHIQVDHCETAGRRTSFISSYGGVREAILLALALESASSTATSPTARGTVLAEELYCDIPGPALVPVGIRRKYRRGLNMRRDPDKQSLRLGVSHRV